MRSARALRLLHFGAARVDPLAAVVPWMSSRRVVLLRATAHTAPASGAVVAAWKCPDRGV